LDDAKEILLKYIAKKNNIIYKRLLNAFRKWKKLLDNNPIIYSKHNNMRRAQKKVNKNEIVKDICDNGAIDKNKKLFMLYRKYNDYSYVMKKKCLRKWKKLIELYDNDNDNEELEYDEEEDEEIEDEEEEEEIEKNE